MRTVLAAGIAAVALVAAGCGGSDGDATTNETWADGLCTALTTWSETLQSAASTLQDTSSLSAESIGSTIDGVIAATSTLADDVKALGRPEIESGDEAQATIEDLADELEGDAATLQQALDDASEGGLTGLLEQVSTITQTLSSMTSALGQAFTDLQALDVQGELEDTLASVDSCNTLVS